MPGNERTRERIRAVKSLRRHVEYTAEASGHSDSTWPRISSFRTLTSKPLLSE